ncbi:MAG: SPOR domain-containing protein [Bacteroidales bacterium]
MFSHRYKKVYAEIFANRMEYIIRHITVKFFQVCFFFFAGILTVNAQFLKVSDLFPVEKSGLKEGRLTVFHSPEIDTLISRYILSNKQLGGGMEGYRIQIYRSSNRNAREESNKIRAQFMVDFPEISSYAEYERPGYFIVRVGDFRTKMEGTRTLYIIRKKYPNAYMVPCIINFPDMVNN